MLGTHWQTTLAGILTIIAALATGGLAILHGQTAAGIAAITTGFTAGMGLIRAADGDKVAPPPAVAPNPGA